MSKAQPGSSTWDVLAGVRFALSMVVVGGHLVCWNASNGLFNRLGSLCAYTAVLCFLVVSGFSIAHSVTSRPDRFYTRRLLRIYPLYLLAVLAGLGCEVLMGRYNANTAHVAASNLLFLQGFRYHSINGNGVIWTLGVEATFYALAPLLTRLRTSALLGLLGLSAMAFLVFPRLDLPYYAALRHGLPVLFLGWAWLAGFTYYRYRGQQAAGMILVGGMVLLTSCNDVFTYRHHEVTVVLSMLALVASGHVQVSSMVCRKVLTYLGDLSYPLYLFHGPVLAVYVGHYQHHAPWPLVGLFLAVAAVMLVVDRQLKRPAARIAEAADAMRRSAVAIVVAEAQAAGRVLASGLSAVMARGVARGAVVSLLAGSALLGTVLTAAAHAKSALTGQ